jgi:hypothetical protein
VEQNPYTLIGRVERRVERIERAGVSGATSTAPAAHASTHLQGGSDAVLPQVVAVNTNTTLAAADQVVLVTGGVTVTLPTSHTSGQSHHVKDAAGTAGTSAITVARGGSATIDGSTTDTINTNWQSAQYVSNGTNWFRI